MIEKNNKEVTIIKPMPFAKSILFFGIPTLIFLCGFYFVMPALIKHGMIPFNAYWIGMGIPFVGMFFAALIAYRLEGNLFVWKAFKERYRLYHIDGKTWLWALLAFIITFFGYVFINFILQQLFISGIIRLPASLPAWIDPRTMQSVKSWDQAFGGLKGNWLAAISYLVFLFFNVVGEELWWRGYILPRQELVFRNWTWVVHGLFWCCFHIFKWWDIPGLLVLTLALSYVVCHFKNTSLGIVLHFLGNGIGLIPILSGILKSN
jgi:membrane protease YdiL (CAAX protease family)